MRVLYVTATLPFSAGAETFFVPEISELMRQGHSLRIVPRSTAGAIASEEARLLQANALSEPLISARVLGGMISQIWHRPLKVAHALSVVLRSRGGMTLLKNLAVFPKGVWLAGIAQGWGAQHIHAQWAATTASIGMVAHLVSGVPWSFTAHRGDITQQNLLPEKARSASFVRFISEDGARMVPCAQAGKATVIHMGVTLPPEAVTPKDETAARSMLCAANLIPVKGHRHLIEAMAILRDKGIACNLIIAGHGELRASLEKQVRELGLTKIVSFLGQLPHEQLMQRYQNGEVGLVVLPSVDLGNHLHEGIPVALIEAMGHGIPVVSTTTGGIPELLRDGAGILVPPANPGALASAVARLLHDGEHRTRTGMLGRKRVSEEYSIGQVVARLVDRIRSAGLSDCTVSSGYAT